MTLEPERPQIEQELSERLAVGLFEMGGFHLLALIHMVSAEATTAALKAVNDAGGSMAKVQPTDVVEEVTGAINDWMNVQKDLILSFDTGRDRDE